MGFERLRTHGRLNWDLARAKIRSFAEEAPVSPIVLNSLPKSGTHLALKLLEALPGTSRIRFQISAMTASHFYDPRASGSVEIGIASPRVASLSRIRRVLSRVPKGAFITAHIPYAEALSAALEEFGYRMVLVVRDPRDVAVSSSAYLGRERNHPLAAAFAAMDENDRMMASIAGFDEGDLRLRDLRSRLDGVLDWRNQSFVKVIRFEDLVGTDGGGSGARQLETVLAVASHVGVDLSASTATELAGELYGGTPTFRQGRIGGWKTALTADHLKIAGPMLDGVLRELGYENDDAWWRAPLVE